MTETQPHQPYITISPEVFELFPGYKRGLVIATQVKNGLSPDELIKKIRTAEQDLRIELSGQDINSVSRLERWREAFRTLGIKPTKFRPSIDSLARRVVSGNDLPSINRLVDIGNLVSLMYLVPVGAHAIDVIKEGMALRRAIGQEEFYPFGSGELEHPDAGELIFVDGNLVMTRRWVWRQAEHTLVLPSTTAVEYNIDLLPPIPEGLEESIFQTLVDLLQEYCGGQIRTSMLEPLHPEIPLFNPDIS